MSIYRTRICQWQFYPNHILLSVLKYIGLAPKERCNFPSPLILHLSLPISLLLQADRDCRLPTNLEGPVPILDLEACICWRNKPRTLFPVPIPAPRHNLPLSQSHFFWQDSPQWARASSFTRFLDHTKRRTTVGRILLNEWLSHRRDLYLTTQNIHNRETSMPPVGFEPTISADERPQTYALDWDPH
jgi:hypothetical protein